MRKIVLSLTLVFCLAVMASAAVNLKVGAAAGIPRVGAELTFDAPLKGAEIVVDAGLMYWTSYNGYSAGVGLIMPLRADISGGLIINYSGFSSDLNLSSALGPSSVAKAGNIGGGIVLAKPVQLFGREAIAKVGYDTRMALIGELSFTVRK